MSEPSSPHDLISGIMYFVELVLPFLNPTPVVLINYEDIVPLTKLAFFLLVSAFCYPILRQFSPFNRVTSAALAICVSFLGCMQWSSAIVVSFGVLYSFTARVLDVFFWYSLS